METNVAFNSIGFHTRLILCRLRNERLKSAVTDEKDDSDEAKQPQDEEARAKLAFVNQRLRDLAAFERRARGEDRARRKR